MIKTLFLAATTLAADETARVTQMVNYTDPLPSAWYSGILDIDGSNTGADAKHLHYMFVESENDPTNDPLMVWFNGGPGCSSMLAFMQENGPLVLEDGDDVPTRNPFPWTAKANIIYLESPAGVGFSTATPTNKTVFNDMAQSEDAYNALAKWFTLFPEFKTNKLFIAGESYGGIYAPYLAW